MTAATGVTESSVTESDVTESDVTATNAATGTENKKDKPVIKVSPEELPVCCPLKAQECWNMHPRVYIKMDASGRGSCPYCGNQFLSEK